MAKISKDAKKPPFKIWKVLLLSGGILFLFLFLINLVASYRGSIEPIKRVADQLKVDKKWKINTNIIRPPRLICIDDSACPSVHRSWSTGTPLTKSEFQAVIQQSGWELVLEDDCRSFPSNVSSCWANGVIDDFQVVLVTSVDNNGELSLFIKQ